MVDDKNIAELGERIAKAQAGREEAARARDKLLSLFEPSTPTNDEGSPSAEQP